MYQSKCNPLLEIIVYSVKHINTNRFHTISESADKLFHSFVILWEIACFLTANLLCPFPSVKSCPLVPLPVLISIKKIILGSIFS